MTSGEFSELWDLLCERFGQEKSADLATFYLEALESRLSDAEIRAGIRSVLYSDTYFPSPERIVEAVQGDAEQGAMDAWETVLEMAKDWRRAKPSEQLSEAGQDALRQVGGIKKLALMDRDDLDFRRRDFLAAYRTARMPVQAHCEELPPMAEDGRKVIETAMAGELEEGR